MHNQWGARPLTPLDLARELFEKWVRRHHRHLDPFGGQSFRNGAADPHARAGDKRRFSEKLQIHDRFPESLAAKAAFQDAVAQAKIVPRQLAKLRGRWFGTHRRPGTLSIGRPTDARRVNKGRDLKGSRCR
jgi:hypothetical protein